MAGAKRGDTWHEHVVAYRVGGGDAYRTIHPRVVTRNQSLQAQRRVLHRLALGQNRLACGGCTDALGSPVQQFCPSRSSSIAIRRPTVA